MFADQSGGLVPAHAAVEPGLRYVHPRLDALYLGLVGRGASGGSPSPLPRVALRHRYRLRLLGVLHYSPDRAREVHRYPRSHGLLKTQQNTTIKTLTIIFTQYKTKFVSGRSSKIEFIGGNFGGSAGRGFRYFLCHSLFLFLEHRKVGCWVFSDPQFLLYTIFSRFDC